MNRSLIILGVAGIFVLLSLLNILRRDNHNTGNHAVYGPKGTDDLPADNLFDFSKAKNLISSAKNLAFVSKEERFATKLITEIKKLLKEHGEKKIFGDFTGTIILNNWRTMINKDQLGNLVNHYNKPEVIFGMLFFWYPLIKQSSADTRQKQPVEILINQLIQKFSPELEQIIFETNDRNEIQKLNEKYKNLTKEEKSNLPEIQRAVKLLSSAYNVLIKELENDKVETFENINEMYPGYSEDSYAQF